MAAIAKILVGTWFNDEKGKAVSQSLIENIIYLASGFLSVTCNKRNNLYSNNSVPKNMKGKTLLKAWTKLSFLKF